MQYLVLGMHRSGTSAVARLLSLMGCYIGSPEELLKADLHNPRGYCERADVLSHHQRLLALFAAGAYRCGHFEPEALAGIDLPELEESGRRILEALERNRPWVLKDPRLCLTFRFWQKLLEAPLIILIHRAPLEVASSLKAQNGVPMPYGIALWEKYNLAALEQTRGRPRVLIAHRELLTDPVRTAELLYRQLVALGGGGLRLPSPEEIEALIEPGLYRQRCDDSQEDEYLNPRQVRLAEALRDGSATGWQAIPGLSQQAREILVNYPETIDLPTEPNPRPEALGPVLEHWGEELPRQRESLERMEGMLDEQRESLLRLAHRLEGLEAEMGRQREALTRQLAESQGRLDSTQADLREAWARLRYETERRALETGAFRSRIAELDRIEKESAASLGQLEGWIVELDAVISAIFDSRSWKLGSVFRELAQKLLFRRPGTLASEHREVVMERFEQWRRERRGGGREVRAVHGGDETPDESRKRLLIRSAGIQEKATVRRAVGSARRPTISVCTLTQNHGATIRACLDSVAAVADEILVVDSGSTDGTLDCVRGYGNSRIIESEFRGIASQRNVYLSEASGDWILAIDADEVMGRELQREIQRLISSEEHNAYWFPRYWLVALRPLLYLENEVNYPDHQLRLIRNSPGLSYHNNVHQQIDIAGLHSHLVQPHLFHLHYLLLDRGGREARLASYEKLQPGAGSGIYRKYYVFEEFPFTIRPCREEIGADLDQTEIADRVAMDRGLIRDLVASRAEM